MYVKSLIQGTLSPSKDDLWAVMLHTVAIGACPSGTEKEIETGDGQMNRTRERGSLGRLFRGNTKTFLNVSFGLIPDSDVGRCVSFVRHLILSHRRRLLG